MLQLTSQDTDHWCQMLLQSRFHHRVSLPCVFLYETILHETKTLIFVTTKMYSIKCLANALFEVEETGFECTIQQYKVLFFRYKKCREVHKAKSFYTL